MTVLEFGLIAVNIPRCLLLCCSFLPGLPLAASPWLVEVDDANPPYMYGERDAVRGLYPALIRAAFQAAGLPVVVQGVPWRRALSNLEAGNAAVGGLYRTAARARVNDFSAPLFSERIVVVYDQRRPLLFRALPDLRGRTLGVIAGWSYGDAFDEAVRSGAITVSPSASDGQNFGKLALGRVDAMLVVEGSLRVRLAAASMPSLRVAPVALAAMPTFLAVSKQAAARPTLQRFNLGLQRLKQRGEYQRLIEQWLTPDGPEARVAAPDQRERSK